MYVVSYSTNSNSNAGANHEGGSNTHPFQASGAAQGPLLWLSWALSRYVQLLACQHLRTARTAIHALSAARN